MASLSLPTTGSSSLGAMARIEARRFARHPVFLTGVVLTSVIWALILVLDDATYFGDALSTPVLPAFFIGLTSLVTAARLTRSTEVAAEAMGTAPGTEAQRTAAVAMACVVPFVAGLAWVVVLLVTAQAWGVHPLEWWFGTMPDWQVWSILFALAPVACLGGGLLGVLTGRWLTFPGAPVAVLVATVVVCIAGNIPSDGSFAQGRLWLPWPLWHSGTFEDGTALIYAGNPAFHLGYMLCLCAAAFLVALWHDRSARTPRLRRALATVVVAGLAFLVLAMVTGNQDNVVSEPIPSQVEG